VETVVAVVNETPVLAGDVVLARALGLFGFEPAVGPLGPAEVERMIRARLVLEEAERVGIEASAADVDEAWRRLADRSGGEARLAAWLAEHAVEADWARRLVREDVRHDRFVELRFRAFVFVGEDEVDAALGPGPHPHEARDRARERLRSATAERRLAEWLREAAERARLRRLLAPDGTVTLDWPSRPLHRAGP
jgi:hypothetical protein